MNMLHFSKQEFQARIDAACQAMQAQQLDGLLLFRQESMYYLTGYDTGGYSMFQAMYLRADGQYALLTRPVDRIQAHATSIIKDIRIWQDGEHANPAHELKNLLAEYGAANQRIGVEYHAYGLTGQRAKMVDAALTGFCMLVDSSDLVRLLRLVKSPAELAYVRKSGELCDAMLATSLELIKPGVSTKAIYGAMTSTLMAGGGDLPASRWPIGAGDAALFARYFTGDNVIAAQDQMVLEPGAAYRHYHTCLMYNVIIGQASDEQHKMSQACAQTLDACLDQLRPGQAVGQVFDLHKELFEQAGYGHASLSACGYTMGAMYPPTWMDWPMFWTGNPQLIDSGMVFFLHMILFDKDKNLSMSLGETVIVTDGPPERVNHAPRKLIEINP